jgi:hypothetical protein
MANLHALTQSSWLREDSGLGAADLLTNSRSTTASELQSSRSDRCSHSLPLHTVRRDVDPQVFLLVSDLRIRIPELPGRTIFDGSGSYLDIFVSIEKKFVVKYYYALNIILWRRRICE